jgi:intron-binding protein aquarius
MEEESKEIKIEKRIKIEIIKSKIEKGENIYKINETTLYPTEKILWDEKYIPIPSKYDTKITLPIPKLGLQYLSMEDYLKRNFILYQLESMFEIKLNIEENIKKMNITLNESTKNLKVNGWSNYCLSISNFYFDENNINKIEDENISPDLISGNIIYSLENCFNNKHKYDWENLKQNDNLFLIYIDPESFNSNYLNIKYIRGCEVLHQEDGDGTIFTGIFYHKIRIGRK